jgi:hypothetical protein
MCNVKPLRGTPLPEAARYLYQLAIKVNRHAPRNGSTKNGSQD